MNLSLLTRSQHVQPSRGSPFAPERRSVLYPPHTRQLLTNGWQIHTVRRLVLRRVPAASSAPWTQGRSTSAAAESDRPLRALMLVLRLTVNWRSGIRVAAALALLVASRLTGAAVTWPGFVTQVSLRCLPTKLVVQVKRQTSMSAPVVCAGLMAPVLFRDAVKAAHVPGHRQAVVLALVCAGVLRAASGVTAGLRSLVFLPVAQVSDHNKRCFHG